MIKFGVLLFNLNKEIVIAEKPLLETIEWLMEGESWIRYRSRFDLLNSDADDPLIQHDYDALISDPKIEHIIKELYSWPGKSIKQHNDANLLMHKLSFLADIGLTIDHPPVHEIVDKVIEFQSKEGPFDVLLHIPVHLGGSEKDERSWLLCDAPNVLYSLVKFGMEKDERVHKALKYLVMRSRKDGWGCTASNTLSGQFRVPGKKEDPCPYAILLMLKVLAQTDTWKYSSACHNGAETLLDLWENSYNKHPFQFKMGTDFRKIKAPLIWFDLLHVAEVLSQFDWVLNDHRFLDMINVITAKANHKMQFTPDSVWKAWEDWDFGQKHEPSRWISFLVLRILKRVEKGTGL